jgi:hypothetical protein
MLGMPDLGPLLVGSGVVARRSRAFYARAAGVRTPAAPHRRGDRHRGWIYTIRVTAYALTWYFTIKRVHFALYEHEKKVATMEAPLCEAKTPPRDMRTDELRAPLRFSSTNFCAAFRAPRGKAAWAIDKHHLPQVKRPSSEIKVSTQLRNSTT